MFNEARIETIRNNIKSSTILSDHEKSDWLNLLDLMNDKQLGELEEILSAGVAGAKAMASAPANSAPTQPAKPQQSAQPAQPTKSSEHAVTASAPIRAMPPLSHIANVPTGVNMDPSVPQSVPPTQPVQAPAPTPRPVQPPKTNFAPLSVRATPSPNLSAPPKPKTEIPRSAISSAPVSAQAAVPTPTSAPSQRQFRIEHAEDLQNLSLESLREYSHESISDVVRAAITEHGYFSILGLIEASPLYAGYIQAGKERLGMASAAGEPIQAGYTQEELEFVADLLINMRFNRW